VLSPPEPSQLARRLRSRARELLAAAADSPGGRRLLPAATTVVQALPWRLTGLHGHANERDYYDDWPVRMRTDASGR
jgi:hypothetical protein